VVKYLTPTDIEATLDVIERRSVVGSRLIIVYHSPAFLLRLVGPALRRLGEPLRSTFTAGQMSALLAKYRFVVVQDEDLPMIGSKLSTDIAQATRAMKHLRITTACRLPGQ